MKLSSFEQIWICLYQVPVGIKTLRILKLISCLGVLSIKEALWKKKKKEEHCEPGLRYMCEGDPVALSSQGLFCFPFLLFSLLHLVPGQPFLQNLGSGEELQVNFQFILSLKVQAIKINDFYILSHYPLFHWKTELQCIGNGNLGQITVEEFLTVRYLFSRKCFNFHL